jgi:hypothetical protein
VMAERKVSRNKYCFMANDLCLDTELKSRESFRLKKGPV